MQAKSERMELRLDQALLDRIDAWRAGERDIPSRSEAVRRLIEAGLEPGCSSNEAPLSVGERLILGMLADVHRASGAKGSSNPELIMSAIYGGHYWAFDWDVGLIHDHVDRRESVTEVVDALDMWSFIEEAAERLSEPERAALPRLPSFPGYDGNHETEHLGIAQFFIDKMGRFERFKGRGLNSHREMVGRYRRMVAKFEPIRANLIGRAMSPAELAEVLAA